MKGINFGGWLVLERWITPSVFEGTDARDEWGLMFTPGGEKRVREHRKTFITEADFAWVKAQGYDLIRLPIGYWTIFPGENYASAEQELHWAVDMAKRYDLKLLICMHGAPGSQNGHDHSGRVGRADWYNNKKYREQTVKALIELAERFREYSQVWGIELLNEPKHGVTHRKLRQFYRDAYREITRVGRHDLVVVFSDAWAPRRMSGVLRPRLGFPVWMDIHWYHMTFPLFQLVPLPVYFWAVRRRVRLIQKLQRAQPVMVGEWSGVLAWQKMRWLSPAKRDYVQRRHEMLQDEVYRAADAYVQWTYKTEAGGLWSVRQYNDQQDLRDKG